MGSRAVGIALLVILSLCLDGPSVRMEAQESLVSSSLNLARIGIATPNPTAGIAEWVNDGNIATVWTSAPTFPGRIKVDWGSLRSVARVTVHFPAGFGARTFNVQYWSDAYGWIDLAPELVGDTSSSRTVTAAAPVSTRAVRVLARWTADGVLSIAELEAFEASADPVPPTPPLSSACGYSDGATLYDAVGHAWSLGGASIVLRDGVPFANGSAARLFIKNGVVYADNTAWGDRWYVSQPAGWAYASAQTCAPPDPALGSRYKVAYWNMQNGAGLEQWVSYGGTCPFPGARYGTQTLNNAWNTGHVQMYLNAYVRSDPEVIAFGATELNSGYAQGISPAAVGAFLGWPGYWYDAEALFARYGFKDLPSRSIIAVGACDGRTPVWGVYAKVFRTAEAAATNSDDYVNVFATHFRHVDASYACGWGDAQGTLVREWLAAHASNGKPTVVIGDLNLLVEPASDPRIQNYIRDGHYWYSASLFPEHMAAWNRAGFVDAYRTVYPNYGTHPGFTSTWHGGPYYATPWKRIDYALVKGSTVLDARLFNDVPESANPKDCVAADHAGLVVTLR